MKRVTRFIIGLIAAAVMTVPTLAAPHASVINIPEGTATIDGVISPGEWDNATEIGLYLTETLAAGGNGDGAGVVGGTPPDEHTNADMTTTVRLKMKDGYLYVLETRKDSTLQFTRDNATMPWASDGSIIFFCKKGENLNTSDLFIMARGKTEPNPMFCVRLDCAETVDISAVAAKSTITEDTFVMEAKVMIADLGNVTEADFRSGDLLVTYCSINIIEPDFDGENPVLWGDNYQLQYIGVGPWDLSPPIRIVADKK